MIRKALAFACLAITVAGCGGGGTSDVGIQLDGNWNGTMVQSTPKKTYTTTLMFTKGTLSFTGNYIDGSSQTIDGSGTSNADLTMILSNNGTPRTFTGSLSVNSSNHVVGTFTETTSSVTLKVDLAPG